MGILRLYGLLVVHPTQGLGRRLHMSKFAKRSIKTALFSAAAALALTGGTPQPAQASLGEAIRLLENHWGWFVSVAWSPHNRQVYMTSLSRQETEAIQRQFQSRANGVLMQRCVDRTSDTYWRRGSPSHTRMRTLYWSMHAARIENGQTNCYLRMPNDFADQFIRRRGWGF